MNCRHCKTELVNVFIDLINSPPSNSFLNVQQLNEPEVYYPLKVYVCHSCFLVQVDEYKKAGEIFNDKYFYYSSFSQSWLEHSKEYTDMMIKEYSIDHECHVILTSHNLKDVVELSDEILFLENKKIQLFDKTNVSRSILEEKIELRLIS